METSRKIVVVTRRTRVEELVGRFHTLDQARFYLEHLGADFGEYQREHAAYVEARRVVEEALAGRARVQWLDRSLLANYLFAPDDVVVGLGQDGLVANALKYLDGQPLIGVNPEPTRFDGVLLPFEPREVGAVVRDVLQGRRPLKSVTMAQATLLDGQVLYAVNDLFIGPRSHTSARYEIRLGEQREMQSSSGLIVSTGLGSTGWMKSIATGAHAVAAQFGGTRRRLDYEPMPWDAPYLRFAVREPFPSVATRATLVCGLTDTSRPLEVRSMMGENGVIFSDGMEADALEFNAGAVAAIGTAARVGHLVH